MKLQEQHCFMTAPSCAVGGIILWLPNVLGLSNILVHILCAISCVFVSVLRNVNLVLRCDHLVLDLMYCGIASEVQFCSRKFSILCIVVFSNSILKFETVAHIYFHLSKNEFNGLHHTNRGVFRTTYWCTGDVLEHCVMNQWCNNMLVKTKE